MCTLTWSRPVSERLEVWFNRDEKKARPIADAPSCRTLNEITFLSPRDPQGGGTWMLVNEFGVVICLLNKWELGAGDFQGQRMSRGALVWRMAVVRSVEELENHLLDLKCYLPFTLVGLSLEEERFWEWDDVSLRVVQGAAPLTSSSYCFEEVKKVREELFARGKRGAEFHGGSGDEASAYSVRMNRADAQTWSRSHLVLDQGITWEYLAEKPDLIGEPERSFLGLSRQ